MYEYGKYGFSKSFADISFINYRIGAFRLHWLNGLINLPMIGKSPVIKMCFTVYTISAIKQIDNTGMNHFCLHVEMYADECVCIKHCLYRRFRRAQYYYQPNANPKQVDLSLVGRSHCVFCAKHKRNTYPNHHTTATETRNIRGIVPLNMIISMIRFTYTFYCVRFDLMCNRSHSRMLFDDWALTVFNVSCLSLTRLDIEPLTYCMI